MAQRPLPAGHPRHVTPDPRDVQTRVPAPRPTRLTAHQRRVRGVATALGPHDLQGLKDGGRSISGNPHAVLPNLWGKKEQSEGHKGRQSSALQGPTRAPGPPPQQGVQGAPARCPAVTRRRAARPGLVPTHPEFTGLWPSGPQRLSTWGPVSTSKGGATRCISATNTPNSRPQPLFPPKTYTCSPSLAHLARQGGLPASQPELPWRWRPRRPRPRPLPLQRGRPSRRVDHVSAQSSPWLPPWAMACGLPTWGLCPQGPEQKAASHSDSCSHLTRSPAGLVQWVPRPPLDVQG